MKKFYKPKKVFFLELWAYFSFGTHEYPMYIFFTKYICAIESNESVSLYKKATEDDRGIIIAL